MRLYGGLFELCSCLSFLTNIQGRLLICRPILFSLIDRCTATLLSPHFLTNDFSTLNGRALPNAPDGYTPAKVDCPSNEPQIRSASGLSPNETTWVRDRRPKTIDPMLDLFKRLNVTGDGFDGASYISDHRSNVTALPNIALAFSGGGYRAMLNGGGVLQAFDSREQNTTSPGQLGGLLQSATYMSGLSGGNWLVGSVYLNNFTTISSLLSGPSGSPWELQNSIFKGPDVGKIQLFDTAKYFDTIYDDVDGKRAAGFPVSLTDYWGRALSFQLINAADGGPAYTWSSIAQPSSQFSTQDTPFPIVVADGRNPGELLISSNTTIYEFNPFEFGTFDPTVYGFAPLEFIGSNFTNGSIAPQGSCVRGLDNAGFVMGTSSSLFNQFLLQVNSTDIPDIAKKFLNRILERLSVDNNDIAEWAPNPFLGYHPSSNRRADLQSLTLVDGGEDLQNIPLQPLIQPFRSVDVIFAVDSSADTETFWPNGTALVATYQRSLDPSGIANGTSFPAIPDVNTFVNLGLNRKPTFFGCNSANTSSITPLIVYIPNSPYTFQSNVSTFDLNQPIDVRNAIVGNGYNVATMGNATIDPNWPQCIGCAILSRSLERTGTPVPDVCSRCFQSYCWDGRTNSSVPPTTYSPEYFLKPVDVNGKESAALGTRDVLGTSSMAAVWLLTFCMVICWI